MGARRDRAWAIVSDCLRAQLYGASTMMVMDRLVRAGYTLDEAGRALQEMREAKLVTFEAGHWVLQASTTSAAAAAPRTFVSWQ